jgi:hypothetical protein
MASQPEINNEAKPDSVTNEVAIFTSKQKIEELANLLKKEEVKPQESNRHAPQKHPSRPKETTKNTSFSLALYPANSYVTGSHIFLCAYSS